MNLLTKIFTTPIRLVQTIREGLRQDVSSEFYKMSKSEFYQTHFPKTYDNTITYIVQYHGVDATTSWGPFNTIHSANEWCQKLLNVYSIECDVVCVQNQKSNPETWFI